MSKYFLITGPGRTGTLFVQTQLNRAPRVDVRHDEFLPGNFQREMTRWRAERTETIGTVCGAARYYIPALWKEFEPIIIFLWCDPIYLVKSLTEKIIQGMKLPRGPGGLRKWSDSHETMDMYLRRNAHVLFGDLEASLSLASLLEIPVWHAHMDDYKTAGGIMQLAEFVGAEIPLLPAAELKPRNVMPDYDKLPAPNTWTYETVSYIVDLTRALPNVRHGYEQSKKGICV